MRATLNPGEEVRADHHFHEEARPVVWRGGFCPSLKGGKALVFDPRFKGLRGFELKAAGHLQVDVFGSLEFCDGAD